MTKPRPWPNEAKAERDNAAEEISSALAELNRLIERLEPGELLPDQFFKSLAIAVDACHSALRWLEKSGADTRPPDPRWKRSKF